MDEVIYNISTVVGRVSHFKHCPQCTVASNLIPGTNLRGLSLSASPQKSLFGLRKRRFRQWRQNIQAARVAHLSVYHSQLRRGALITLINYIGARES